MKKRVWLHELVRSKRPAILGLQETKSASISERWIESIWDSSLYSVSQLFGDKEYLATFGSWKGLDTKLCFINVYGPRDDEKKKKVL